MHVAPYLRFAGCCEEALSFYADKLGAKIVTLVRATERVEPCALPQMNVLHADFVLGDCQIKACDVDSATYRNDRWKTSLYLALEDENMAEDLFVALADGGAVKTPLSITASSGRFGILEDRFGVEWLLVVERPSSQDEAGYAKV